MFPTDYGYLPDTLAPDGDPLDVLVCVSEPTFPGCMVPVRPIGLFCMSDEHGKDDKVVTVPINDPQWNTYFEADELPRFVRDEIFHFFTVYKDLDLDRHSEPTGWRGRMAALAEIAEAQERFRSQAS